MSQAALTQITRIDIQFGRAKPLRGTGRRGVDLLDADDRAVPAQKESPPGGGRSINPSKY